MSRLAHLLTPALLGLLPLLACAADSPQVVAKANIPFDVYGTSLKDDGVAALPLPDGKVVVIGRVDIANADTRVVGIGLSRRFADGSIDYSFSGGVRIKDAGLTSIVGACRTASGQIIVAGTTPHSSSPYSGHHLALVAFNADGSDNLGFGSYGRAIWNSGSVLNYSARGVSCGDGDRMVVFGSELGANGARFAVSVGYGPNGAALGSMTVAGAAYNDEITAAYYDASIAYDGWWIARRSQHSDGTAEVVIVRRSSYMDRFSGSPILTPPASCGSNPQRVGGFVKAIDGSVVATLGDDYGAKLWRFPASGSVGACSAVPALDRSIGIPARLPDGRIALTDDLATLQNDGATARVAVMKPSGSSFVADPVVNGNGLIYFLHPTSADAYSTTFARSIAVQGSQLVVVGTKNYRNPDYDLSLTRISP